ncbi:MAG: ABC transporter ATP-binding protein [Solirubrobacteraceae bacterium]
MNAIEVSGLAKRYGELEAVRGASFEVAAGEVFCLLGPNGAGKTTIAEILEGYRTRSGGEVSVLGVDPAVGSRELRERVGIVLQSCGVQDALTVGELLEMYGRYHRRRRSAGELIELVELDAKRDTRAAQLSGGQRRRLDLALALVGDPDLVFLDEPTTGFDPQARRQAWATIRALCGLGKTIFLTTHFMDEAQTLADRVAVMRAGEIIATGPPNELGGRDARPAEIRFELPDGWTLEQLPAVAALERIAEGRRVLIRTDQTIRTTAQITAWALENDLELAQFSVSQPSLEDVYLELTGEHVADEREQIEALRR